LLRAFDQHVAGAIKILIWDNTQSQTQTRHRIDRRLDRAKQSPIGQIEHRHSTEWVHSAGISRLGDDGDEPLRACTIEVIHDDVEAERWPAGGDNQVRLANEPILDDQSRRRGRRSSLQNDPIAAPVTINIGDSDGHEVRR
jgi:hypothetical protein